MGPRGGSPGDHAHGRLIKMDDSERLAAHFFREHAGRMVASFARVYGMHHLDDILDAVQDAFETALVHWRYHGTPDNPPAWLSRVARNKLVNTLKRASRHISASGTEILLQNEAIAGAEPLPDEEETDIDSQIQLLIACCDTALRERDRILVTLHILCGFGVPELANALRMNAEAVKKALQRTKAVLRQRTIRLDDKAMVQAVRQSTTVCTILYLMFNEGHKATRDTKGIDIDLCYEAIRLAKLLCPKAPPEAEVDALLALMFFGVARFPTRLGPYGEWIPLAEQDRKRWDHRLIAEGFHYLDRAKQHGYAGKYYLEALIASHHCAARHFEETNWNTIFHLYQLLAALEPASLPIRLNRLVAQSYATGPLSAIPELETIADDGTSGNAFLLAATKGYIHQRAGNIAQAQSAYREALPLAQNPLDVRLIEKRMKTLSGMRSR